MKHTGYQLGDGTDIVEKIKGKASKEELNGAISRTTVFTNPEGVDPSAGIVNGFGGLTAGTVVNNMPLVDLLSMAMFPYQPPRITSFASAQVPASLECGATLNPTSGDLTFTWSYANIGNIEDDTPVILKDKTANTELWRGTKANTTCTVPFGAITKNAVGNQQFELSTVDKKGSTISALISTLWQWRYYWTVDENDGAVPTPEQIADGSYIDSDTLKTFSSKLNAQNGTQIVMQIPVGSRRILIAYPSNLRDVTSIASKAQNGADMKQVFVKGVTGSVIEGATPDAKNAYKVYVYQTLAPYPSADTYTVTI